MQDQRLTFKSLEGLRGYMAWSVVFDHAVAFVGMRADIPAWWGNTFLNGGRAVNVFIIVSGFVISHLIILRQESYGQYLLRRALRIFPIYLICLLMALIFLEAQVELHGLAWVTGREILLDGFESTRRHLSTHVLLHLSLLHGVIPDSLFDFSGTAILGPAWTLSLEWQFYLVAPALLHFLRTNRFSMLITLGSLAIAFSIFHFSRIGLVPRLVFWRFPSMLLSSIELFLLGILCRLYLKAIMTRPWLVPTVGLIGACFAASFRYELTVWTLFLYSSVMELELTPQSKHSPIMLLRWFTGNPWVTSLGKASYSTYLIHIPLFACIVYVGRHALGANGRDGVAKMLAIAIVLLIPLSFLLYRYIEVPFIRLGSKLTAIKPIVSSAGAV